MDAKDARPRPPWYDRHLWQIKPVGDLLLAGALIAFLWAGLWLRPILMPVFAGLLLAYLVHPIITQAHQRWSVPRWVSALVCLLSTALFLAGVGVWLVPMLVQQTQSLLMRAPAYLERVSENLGLELVTAEQQIVEEIEAYLQEPASIMELAGRILGITSGVVIWATLMPISFIFAAIRFPSLLCRAGRYIPAERRERPIEILEQMDMAVGRFLRGRLLISVIIGVMSARPERIHDSGRGADRRLRGWILGPHPGRAGKRVLEDHRK